MYAETIHSMQVQTLIHILFYIVIILYSVWLNQYFLTRRTPTSSSFFAFPVTNTTALPVGTAMLLPVSVTQHLTVGTVKHSALSHHKPIVFIDLKLPPIRERFDYTLDTPCSHTDQSLDAQCRPSVKSLRVESAKRGESVIKCQ